MDQIMAPTRKEDPLADLQTKARRWHQYQIISIPVPVQLLMKRKLRTHLHLVKPDISQKVKAKHFQTLRQFRREEIYCWRQCLCSQMGEGTKMAAREGGRISWACESGDPHKPRPRPSPCWSGEAELFWWMWLAIHTVEANFSPYPRCAVGKPFSSITTSITSTTVRPRGSSSTIKPGVPEARPISSFLEVGGRSVRYWDDLVGTTCYCVLLTIKVRHAWHLMISMCAYLCVWCTVFNDGS